MIAPVAIALLAASQNPTASLAQGACVSVDALTPAKAVALPRGRWSDEVHRRLVDVIRSHGAGSPRFDPCKRPLAVLDWDNTVIAGDIGDQAFYTGAERGMFKLDPLLLEPLTEEAATSLRAAFEAGGPELRAALHRSYDQLCATKGSGVCYPWVAQLFHGHSRSALEAFAAQVIEAETERPVGVERVELPGGAIELQRGVRVRPEMQALIAALQETGFDVFVVTASPEWLVQVFAPRAGVPRENVVGIRLFQSAAGVLSPRIDPPVTYRTGKVVAIRTQIAPGGRRPVLAFGDAETDWEMLDEASGLAVLFDRKRPALRAHAVARGWAIQPLFEDRAESPAPKPRR